MSTLRLGIPRAIFYEKLDPEIEPAVNSAIEVLRKLTASVHDVQLPTYEALPIVGAEAYVYHAPYLTKTPETLSAVDSPAVGGGRQGDDGGLHPGTPRTRAVTPGGPRGIRRDRSAGHTHDLCAAGNYRGKRPDRQYNFASQYCAVYGLPTISVPCGFTSSGLPIGLQISGPPFGEPTVLALAHAYEQATDWHTHRPKVVL